MRGVGHDQPVDAAGQRHLGDVALVLLRQVGRYLQKQRRRVAARRDRCRPSVQRPPQQLGQRLAALKCAQARRVGRRDVDHQIRRQGGEPADADHVVGGGVGRFLVLADIGADQPGPPAPRFQPAGDRVQPVVVEAIAVDHRLGFRHAEDARAGIARLRTRRHAADLDEAEALGEHGIGHFRILVEAGGKADRIGEVQPPDARPEDRVLLHPGARRQTALQCRDGDAMGGFRVQPAQQRTRDRVKVDHSVRPWNAGGKTCLPSGPSGSGSTAVTASTGRGP